MARIMAVPLTAFSISKKQLLLYSLITNVNIIYKIDSFIAF